MIYVVSDSHAKYQLSRLCGACFRLWKQDRAANLGDLLHDHPLHVHGFTSTVRTMRRHHDYFASDQLDCVTLRVHLTAEAMGQYLVLAPHERRAVGTGYSEDLVRFVNESVLDNVDNVDHVSILIHHDAVLKPTDYLALRDLLWDFPYAVRQHSSEAYAVDAQWWITTYPSSAKPMPWDCWHFLGMTVEEDNRAIYVDSLTEFVQ